MELSLSFKEDIMKLSKAVKEYISAQICTKVANSKRMEELRCKRDEAIKNLQNDIELFENEVSNKARKLLRKHGIEKSDSWRCPRLGYCENELPAVKAYRDAETEVWEKRRIAELNIIATMELGGNKADLMKMLEELEF